MHFFGHIIRRQGENLGKSFTREKSNEFGHVEDIPIDGERETTQDIRTYSKKQMKATIGEILLSRSCYMMGHQLTNLKDGRIMMSLTIISDSYVDDKLHMRSYMSLM